MAGEEVTVPTQEEILTRIAERKDDDILGFEWSEYVTFLDFDRAKPWLGEKTTREEWEKAQSKLDRETLLKRIADYMEFAWEKANNCRGISSNRSILHYIAWTWLAGDKDFSDELDNRYSVNFEFYGKDILVLICDHYGLDAKKWDNGRRANNESEDEAIQRSK